jgi:AcrR family transcriptional regulator
VLVAALMAFWEHGFEGTTASRLSEVTGLNPSSLYNAFGSKRQLFVERLDVYRAMLAPLFQPLLNGSAGLDDIAEFFAVLRQTKHDDGAIGSCLIANTIAEQVSGHEVLAHTDGYRRDLGGGFAQALQRAVARGELAAHAPASLEPVLVHTVIGLLVATRGAEPPFDDSVVEGLPAALEQWRIEL